MKLVNLLLFFSIALAYTSAGNIVCFFASWTIYRTGDGKFAAANVDPTLCTHVIYAFIGLNPNGTVHILDDWDITGLMEIDHLMSLKETNPDLKILACMGGYNEGSETYSIVAADPDLRATMINSTITFLQKYKFDGLDMDWENPGQRNGSDPINDPANFVTWLGELKAALNAEDLILSATVSGGVYSIDLSYPDGAGITDNVDILNVETYDYHGEWEDYVGHNAPLYASHLDTGGNADQNVASGIQRWLDNGADPAKIHLGIPTYGRTWTLADPADAELYAPVNGTGLAGPYTDDAAGGTIGYNEVCALYTDYEEIWDDEQMVPHKVLDDQWVGYDNVESVTAKVQFANEQGLGGISVWTLDTDDFLGTCGDKYPLLTAINENLN